MKKNLLIFYRFVVKASGRLGLGRFVMMRNLNRIIFTNFIARFRTNSAEVQGHTMFLDPQDSLGLSIFGEWEPFETDLIKKYVGRGDIVLDIGANIGYYTLIFARLVGDDGKVFAFEPDPENFALLKKNVEVNAYRNVTLVQKAVSNENKRIRLYLSVGNKGDHRIYDSANNRPSVAVDAVRLDDFLNEFIGRVDFIKMDIQGAEGKALEGMSMLVRSSKQVKIITEFWPSGLEQSGVNPRQYLRLLSDFGFTLYQIDETRRTINAVNPQELLDSLEKSDIEMKQHRHWRTLSHLRSRWISRPHANLLCIRKA